MILILRQVVRERKRSGNDGTIYPMGQINAGTWMVSLVILVGSDKSMNEWHRTK